jgi:hypothetical protein
MPLTICDLPGVIDSERRAVGVWMVDQHKKPVWVLVTYEALHEIDSHSRSDDAPAVLEIFEGQRRRIEATASAKFDAAGVDAGRYEGQPIMVVRSGQAAGPE